MTLRGSDTAQAHVRKGMHVFGGTMEKFKTTTLRPTWKLSSIFSWLLICSSVASVAARQSVSTTTKWKTLSGNPPLVIANGGFSGMFPDSSIYAYNLALVTSSPSVHLWCDVRLTKDAYGICAGDIKLDNTSDISFVYPNSSNTYAVNGISMSGWFSLDFTLHDLNSVNLNRRIYSRTPRFDETPMSFLTVEDVSKLLKPPGPGLWLNIQHSAFYAQHNLSMTSFVLSVSRRVNVNYISSPEIGFLQSIASRTGLTKHVFKFLEPDEIEITTNQTHDSLLRNLTFIKTFASGIMVPKAYVWPVDSSLYLQNHNSLVTDAHKAGLEIFASGFANDAVLPYDYDYDPVAEYLKFINNGDFSVDGVVSDFPSTPSASIDCFSNMSRNDPVQANFSVISSEGASGHYRGCTDLAYNKAVTDGVDVLDCPVQMTSDGIPFCLGSINLKDRTNIGTITDFSNLTTDDTDLNIKKGILSYNVTWAQIQTLKPSMSNPFRKYGLFRNPKSQNDGKLMQLSEFLELASKSPSVSGVLIGIENAVYLSRLGLDVAGAVMDSLAKSAFNDETARSGYYSSNLEKAKTAMIKSTDLKLLKRFKGHRYSSELVYLVGEDIEDITNSTLVAIKKVASSVIVSKKSLFSVNKAFLKDTTDVVQKLQGSNITVYVELFRNEFVSQPYDFFSDPYVEINMYVSGMGINGTVTDFPLTASMYKRNRCLGYKQMPAYMPLVPPGGLLSLIAPEMLPPAEAPAPVLAVGDVSEPPPPPLKGEGPTQSPPNGQSSVTTTTAVFSGFITVLLAALVL